MTGTKNFFAKVQKYTLPSSKAKGHLWPDKRWRLGRKEGKRQSRGADKGAGSEAGPGQ